VQRGKKGGRAVLLFSVTQLWGNSAKLRKKGCFLRFAFAGLQDTFFFL